MYNAAQQRALSQQHSVWLSAHAGTGKTAVLTGRVLRLLLEGVKPQKILCMTYTKAAAAEMSGRIRQRIAEWVAMEERALIAALTPILERTPSAVELSRARACFAEVVDRPHQLQITTLHGFCQKLLQQFPLEAGLSPAFRVVEEEEEYALERQALEAVLCNPALEDTVAFLACRLSLDQWQKQLHAGLEVEDLPQRIEKLAACVAEPDPRVIAPNATVLHWSGGVVFEEWEAYAQQFLTKEYTPRKTLLDKDQRAAHPEWEAPLRAEQQRVYAAQQAWLTQELHRQNWHMARAMQAFGTALEAVKAKAQAVTFGDLIRKARALLSDAEAADWVRYKLEGGITHLLLDEAQDTGPEQWAIVEAICAEFFAGESARSEPRTLFVVGDPKQSIYRFQGAEAALFVALREKFSRLAAGARHPFLPEALALSYRSTPPVLQVVDAVLAQPAYRESLGLDAVPPHEAHRRDVAGSVVLWPVVEVPPAPPADGWQMPVDRAPKPDPQGELVRALADTVQEWLNTGRPLAARQRPLTPGDILILLRERGELMPRLVRAFKQRNIPVAGVDRLHLAKHLWVRDLLSLARFLLLPQDDFSLLCVLSSPLFGYTETERFALAHGREQQSIWQVLQAKAPESEVVSRLKTYLNLADRVSPFALFMRVLEADGGGLKAIARMGPDVREISEAFLEQVRQYEEQQTPTLQGFVHWMEQREVPMKRTPEGAGDKVRILSVHGAKGLQAPVVILADACRSANPRNSQAAFYRDEGTGHHWWLRGDLPEWAAGLKAGEKQAEASENARLLYVALTRAEDELYITGFKTPSGRQMDTRWLERITKAMEQCGAVEEAAPQGFGGKALALHYRPAGTVGDMKPQALKTEPPKLALPEWLYAPAPQEQTERRATVTASGGPASEASLAGERLHRELETGEARSAEIAAVLAHPQLQPYLDPATSLAEVTVRGQGVEGRIDRLVVTENEVVILDFKTGAELPPALPEAYRRQLSAYKALISPLYPEKPIRAGVFYTKHLCFQWLDFPG